MHRLPQRESLVHQVVDLVRKSLEAGLWGGHLPGELELCRKFQVSRSTLRAALEILTKENLIASSQGRRRQVLKPAIERTAPVSRLVVLLAAVPLERMNGAAMLLVDDLREQLAKDRLDMELHASPACFGLKPEAALEHLVREKSAAVWVLLSAPLSTQRWFMEHGLPCVLVGSQHSGIALPALDADFAAMGQHAARQFLSRGHRRLAVVSTAVDKAGDVRTLEAFRSVCEQTPGTQVIKIGHDGTPEGIQRCLSAMLKKPLPTGLLVAQPRNLLTVMSYLGSQGVRVPRDISIISRDSESFLDFLVPLPARYVVAPAAFARKLSQLVRKMARGEPVPPRGLLLMPTFIAGETLAYLSGKKTS